MKLESSSNLEKFNRTWFINIFHQ